MSLFQTQVERQFLAGITTDLVPVYNKFVDYFGNPAIQANILEVSEEQYQGEFVRALFVDILGYTAQPHPNFNLIREKKNETDAKSADAAISINNQIVAVVELKDHKTQDLKKVEVQAFGYKNNHKNCRYVVTSNFERLRFYIDNAVDYIEFDLFKLSFDEFRRLWLCLSYESISKNLPQVIKNQSISSEDVITKKLYKDYSVFKRQLFDSIVTLNPDYDKLLLFKKTQKLLDRFLFLFFAEDKQLLPANSVIATIEKWKKFNADPMNDYQSLYSRFVKYFKLLDVGYKDANTEIYAYNGGLFANDELLNQIKVDDGILSDNVLKLAVYDYDTDVDVNILGHIFENSLNEIEQVANEITSGTFSSPSGRSGGVSKRKQDGVFYTPRYITQYIVENTVGRLCEEKKTELGIVEGLFEFKAKSKKEQEDKKKQALKVFDTYREWLLQITIVDPACGSGAFLNTALDFLIAEHKWIDNQQDKIAGSKDHYTMGLSNIENTILENNLFGVDINEESVEIAKLSLWLRTAKPHRKLSSLNNNIKCGNSLIDDPAVAGEKAFDWHKEFPQVFGREQKVVESITLEKEETPNYLKLIKEKSAEAQLKAEQGIALSKEALEITKQLAEYAEKLDAVSAPKAKYEKLNGGFDVVIGNPPYGATLNDLEKKFIENRYLSFEYQVNTYVVFYEKGLSILKPDGLLGFITPATFTYQHYFSKIRELFQNYKQIAISKYSYEVFDDADIGDSVSWIISKTENDFSDISFQVCINKEDTLNKIPLIRKFNQLILMDKTYNLSENESLIDKFKNSKYDLFDDNLATIIVGIKPYQTGKGFPKQTKEDVIEKKFTSTKKVDNTYIECVIGKDFHKYKFNNTPEMYLSYGKWLAEPRQGAPFFEDKIIIRQTADSLICNYDSNKWINLNNVYNIGSRNKNYKLKYLLSLLNSKLLNYLYQSVSQEKGRLFAEVKKVNLMKLPIRKISIDDQKPFVENADQMLSLNERFQETSQKFQRMLQRKFELEDLPGKLQNWYLLSYKEFIAELGKKKVKLTLAQEAEWEDYFNTEKSKALEIKNQIDSTDKEIDRMVYALYELTQEEVKIVEGDSA